MSGQKKTRRVSEIARSLLKVDFDAPLIPMGADEIATLEEAVGMVEPRYCVVTGSNH